MGIQRARDVLMASHKDYVYNPCDETESAFLAAAEQYGREKIHARNRRDAWKLRKRLKKPA